MRLVYLFKLLVVFFSCWYLQAFANPHGEYDISTCSSSVVASNGLATCSGSFGRAPAGSLLKFAVVAKSGRYMRSVGADWSGAAGIMVVTNNTGWVLMSQAFSGSSIGIYSRALNSAGRFRITVSVTDKYSRPYSFVSGRLTVQDPRNVNV